MSDQFNFLQFPPGKRWDGAIKLDLLEGFSWLAWLQINPTGGKRQKIWSAGTGTPNDILSLGVDRGNNLTFAAGNRSVSIPAAHVLYGDWIMVGAYVKLKDKQITLELEIDDEARAITEERYNGPTELTKQVMGGGDGDFRAAEIVGYERALPRSDRGRLYAYLRTKRPRR